MLPPCGGNYTASSSHVLANNEPSHTASTRFPTRENSRVANASLVRLEPPLVITPLLILRVTVSVD